MSKRFNDIPYNTFSLWTNIAVICPKCNKVGTVYFDNQHNTATFQCQSYFMEKNYVKQKWSQCSMYINWKIFLNFNIKR